MSREHPQGLPQHAQEDLEQPLDQDAAQGVEGDRSQELTLEQLEEHIGAAGRLHQELSSRLEATARD